MSDMKLHDVYFQMNLKLIFLGNGTAVCIEQN